MENFFTMQKWFQMETQFDDPYNDQDYPKMQALIHWMGYHVSWNMMEELTQKGQDIVSGGTNQLTE